MKHNASVPIDPAAIGFISYRQPYEELHYQNVNPLINEASPFCLPSRPFFFEGDGLIVDPCYGQIYEPRVRLPYHLYGKTSNLPPYAGEVPSNSDFIRVPFRRIPRIPIGNRREFDQFVQRILSADRNLITLFRGQNREYFLERGNLAGDLLYGDETAREPSLPSSASRHQVNLEDIGSEWSAAVQLFIYQWVSNVKITNEIAPRTFQKISEQMEQMVSGYNLWDLMLSLAQHYGLPSAGIDVTDRPEVALFFALTRIFRSEPGSVRMKTERVSESNSAPVIYIFACPKTSVMEFKRYRPLGFPISRPDKQSAVFLHTAWGYARHIITNRIWVVLRLDPNGDWGQVPTEQELFPSEDDDPFADFLLKVREWNSGEAFRGFLQYFYLI